MVEPVQEGLSPTQTSTSTANKAAVNRQSSVGHHLQVRIVAALVPRQRPANRSKCGMHWMPRVGECAAVRSHGASWIIRVLAWCSVGRGAGSRGCPKAGRVQWQRSRLAFWLRFFLWLFTFSDETANYNLQNKRVSNCTTRLENSNLEHAKWKWRVNSHRWIENLYGCRGHQHSCNAASNYASIASSKCHTQTTCSAASVTILCKQEWARQREYIEVALWQVTQRNSYDFFLRGGIHMICMKKIWCSENSNENIVDWSSSLSSWMYQWTIPSYLVI